MISKEIDKCLLCNQNTQLILSLGSTPLANEFVKDKLEQELFPLNIIQCQECNHVQINCIVDKKRLFENYFYVASTSSTNVKHFQDYALKIINKFSLTSDDIVCDIASNDGCFLKNFKKNNIKIIGIDPAKNIAEKANLEGMPTIPEFFGLSLANDMLQKYGKFKIITCNNMLAHNKDIDNIVLGIKNILDENGSFVFENSYLLDICNKTLIDLIYHEHIHHFHLTPLIKFFNKFNMDVYEVERLPNHGGSIRVYICFKGKIPIDNSVFQMLELEKDINSKLLGLKNNIKSIEYQLKEKLQDIKKQNKSIAIYGFPAKATTLMYAFGIDENMIDFVVDDAILKQGMLTPGKHIPIFDPSVIYDKNPDYLLILAWNFAESIINNHPNFNGKWIIPIPELRECP